MTHTHLTKMIVVHGAIMDIKDDMLSGLRKRWVDSVVNCFLHVFKVVTRGLICFAAQRVAVDYVNACV